MDSVPPSFSHPRRGFTLIEVLCSTVVLIIVLLLITSVVQRTARVWRESADQNRSFQNAQRAFDAITRNLEQATLNTYWASLDSSWQPVTATTSDAFKPAHYGRMSELHFVAGPASSLLNVAAGPGTAVFFQTPLGFSEDASYTKLQGTLNVCGYWVQWTDDTSEMPAFVRSLVAGRQRYRLMELLQPTESLGTYCNQTDATYTDWFSQPAATSAARAIADNIILLAIRWVYPAADGSLIYTYSYNSRTGATGSQPVTQHQLPPRAEVTMVALDETSALRAAAAAGEIAPALVASGLFTDPTRLSDDRTALESSLAAKGYRFHTFTAEVFLKASKWSSP